MSMVCTFCCTKQCCCLCLCLRLKHWNCALKQAKIQETFSIEMKTTREVFPWFWSKRLLQSTTGWHFRITFRGVKQNPELLCIYHYCEFKLWGFSSLVFSSPLWHFSSPHLTLTAQPLCTVCSRACCILHGYNGGRKKKMWPQAFAKYIDFSKFLTA